MAEGATQTQPAGGGDAATTGKPEEGKPPQTTPAGDEAATGNGSPGDTVEEWKQHARKHERRWKEEKEAREALDAELKQIRESNMSETEKAIEKAKAEARAEAQTAFEQERRNDRLSVAVSKHARDLADVDDVLLNITQRLASNDISDKEIFDKDGRVQSKALEEALAQLLKDKPHLKASPHGRPTGDVDAGQGSGGGGTTFNDTLRSRARR